ncbi:Oidioi.mRNA.OKI2018_I69.XSR.g14723.t1.cds [Oikopleura dioica]|uniref:Oidioi.mRNA.OKI2018_I69.XSR.g14723.t1.cds n=1 Tax=Oikopleura dioica TaxID=34765 RepID=A0ABN7SGY2_OIKDI|nr:Oidioi.mRNA.OKI2018_I69.XSR.g14723.t1.cds [Oikopleura dioica]
MNWARLGAARPVSVRPIPNKPGYLSSSITAATPDQGQENTQHILAPGRFSSAHSNADLHQNGLLTVSSSFA